MSKYEWILFDLDGTVTDPKEGITKCVQYALNSLGITENDLDSLCKFIGPPLKDSFIHWYNLTPEQGQQALEKYRERFSVTGLYENVVYDGIEDLLKSLKKANKKIVIATSKPEVFAIKILEHFDLIKYFDMVCGSDLEGTRVKKAAVIKYAFEKNNITPSDSVIMVGDREHDIIGAHENGIKCIGVLYGYGDINEHKNANADFTANTIDELGKILL